MKLTLCAKSNFIMMVNNIPRVDPEAGVARKIQE
jgi:hypothetical protein